VFQFVPHFVLGAVLGFLVVRSGSLLPGIVFHLIYNVLVFGPYCMPNVFDKLGYADASITDSPLLRVALAGAGSLVVAAVLLGITRWTRPPVAEGGAEQVDTLAPIDKEPLVPALAARPVSNQLKAADQRFHDR
jgi:hypothetical protein